MKEVVYHNPRFPVFSAPVVTISEDVDIVKALQFCQLLWPECFHDDALTDQGNLNLSWDEVERGWEEREGERN